MTSYGASVKYQRPVLSDIPQTHKQMHIGRWLPYLHRNAEYNSKSIGINTLRPRQNGRHFSDDTFKSIFLNENIRISINISLKFVPKVQ